MAILILSYTIIFSKEEVMKVKQNNSFKLTNEIVTFKTKSFARQLCWSGSKVNYLDKSVTASGRIN